MTNPDASVKLKTLVGQAQATANRLLRPRPMAHGKLLATDYQSLLAGLRCQEQLSGFHPFGEPYYPIPDETPVATSGVVPGVVPGEIRNNIQRPDQPTAGPETIQDNTVVLNQAMTRLIEQVYRSTVQAPTGEDKKEPAEQTGKRPTAESVATRYLSSRALNAEKIRTGMTVPAHGKNDVTDNETTARSSGQNDNPALQQNRQSHPVFSQLENLVSYFEKSEPSSFPVHDAASDGAGSESPVAPEPVSHLADLTQVLAQRRHPVGVPSAGTSDRGPGKNEKLQTQREQGVDSRTRKAGASSANDSHHPTASQQPPQHVRGVADIVKRSSNLRINEQIAGVSGLQGLSPTETQRMADALNDYLQEQAEQHGVDLS